MKLICYKKCTTCKGVEKMLKDKGINYEYRDIKEDNPSYSEIRSWHELTDYDIKKFFNTSGKIYREENIKDKLPEMELNDIYTLLSKDGMLVKRPILFTDDDKIFIGRDAVKYIESL